MHGNKNTYSTVSDRRFVSNVSSFQNIIQSLFKLGVHLTRTKNRINGKKRYVKK